MAVQMMSSSTQDLLMTSTPRDISAPVDREEAGKFEEALVGAANEVSSESSDQKGAEVKEVPKAARPKRAADVKKISSQVKEVEAAIPEAAEVIIPEAAEVDSKQIDAMAVSDIMAMIRSISSEEPETTIDELIAHAADVAPKTTRFDPDLILGTKQIEEPKVESLPIVEAMAELDTQLKDIANVAAPAAVQAQPEEIVADDLTLPEDAVVGDAGDGEIKIKLPETSDAKIKDLRPVDEKIAENAPQVEVTDETAEEVVEHVDARPVIDAPIKNDRIDGERELDRKIAEMLDKYEERRRGEDGSMPRVPRAEERSAQKKPVPAAAAKKISVQPQPQARDSRADQMREAPFAETLSSRLREANEATTSEAQRTFRAGMIYEMSRDDAFSDGIGTVLEFMRTDQTQEARIVVEPPALGHIDISLRATEAGMEAHFKVDNEHLKQMVQQHLDILKSSLQTQGIHVTNIAVDIRNKDDQNSGQGASRSKGKKGRSISGVDGADEEGERDMQLVRLDLEKGLLHWIG